MFIRIRLLFKFSAVVFLIPSGYAAAPSVATQRLLERNKILGPRIIQVAANVYTAVGYSPSTNSMIVGDEGVIIICLLYTSPSPRDVEESRMPSSA